MFALLTPFFASLKAYALGIAAGVLLVAFGALGVKLALVSHQRNDARAQVVKLQATIQAYQAASDAARARVAAAVVTAELTQVHHAALMADLNTALPQSPDAALAWAVAAGKRIEATR